MKNTVILLLVILAFSCSSNNNGTKGVVNLKVNGCFHEFQNRAQICLDSVFNDSRCPSDLVCVWEGDALAAFTITKNDNVSNFNLHSHSNFQSDTIIDGITITLINIWPYPISGRPIEPHEYSVEIKVDEY